MISNQISAMTVHKDGTGAEDQSTPSHAPERPNYSDELPVWRDIYMSRLNGLLELGSKKQLDVEDLGNCPLISIPPCAMLVLAQHGRWKN